MKLILGLTCAFAILLPGASGAQQATSTATAGDKLKVAIGQINNWENQVPTLGMAAGIFHKHGIEVETLGAQGAGGKLPPGISGSGGIGIGGGTAAPGGGLPRGAP